MTQKVLFLKALTWKKRIVYLRIISSEMLNIDVTQEQIPLSTSPQSVAEVRDSDSLSIPRHTIIRLLFCIASNIGIALPTIAIAIVVALLHS